MANRWQTLASAPDNSWTLAFRHLNGCNTEPDPSADDTDAMPSTESNSDFQDEIDFQVHARSELSVCAHAWKPAPSACYNIQDSVHIEICGTTDEKKKYLLPRGLLRWHSSYFAAALDPESDLAKTKDGKALSLEEDIKVFDAFVSWLWTGQLQDEPLEEKHTHDLYLDSELLCKVWIFGDMRGVPALCNAALDMLHEKGVAERSFPFDIIRDVYERTVPGAMLRTYLVDNTIAIFTIKELTLELDPEDATVPFLLDVMPRLSTTSDNAKLMSSKAWTKVDRCQWHDHSGPGGKSRLASRT